MRNPYAVLLGKPECKIPLGKPRHMWGDTFKVGLKRIECEGVEWVQLV
jgi:hypothetical protein